MTASRKTVEGPKIQGVDEEIVYTLDTINWGGSPSNPIVTVKDGSANMTDVTVLTTTGSASVLGHVIILPVIRDLTEGHWYRVEVMWTYSTSLLEAYFVIVAEV
jgi:hypothetical protein